MRRRPWLSRQLGALLAVCLAACAPRISGEMSADNRTADGNAQVRSRGPAETLRFNIHDGGHRALDCTRCHSADEEGHISNFKNARGDCISCHKADDEHNGKLGERCAMCHGASKWKAIYKGHDATPQPFGGAHDRLACQTCHSQGRSLRGQADQCVTCHQRDDIHHNSLGPRCSDCHTQRSFAPARFNHDTVGCTLRGVHRVLPCLDCHKAGNYAGLSPTCVSCHRDDAMRAASAGVLPTLHIQQTACTTCHNPVSFRGALTRQSPPESVCQ